MTLMDQVLAYFQKHPWSTYALASTAVCFSYYVSVKVERSYQPPGPFPLPFIGTIVNLPLHESFAQLRRKYGDIFSFKMGGVNVVVVNGYRNVKDALSEYGRAFSGRPSISYTQLTKKYGIFSNDGPAYRKQKSIVMDILAKLSWAKKEQAESRILETARDLIDWINSHNGAAVDPRLYLDTAACNASSPILIGIKFHPSDEIMKSLSKIVKEIFIDAGLQNLHNYYPLLRYMPGECANYRTLANNIAAAKSVIEKVVDDHKTQGSERHSLDFIDLYLKQTHGDTEESATNDQLIGAMTDLLAMSIEAPSTTLRWTLLLLCKHPDVQAKVQKEIDEVMGQSTPALVNEAEMPYTKAMITEVQRYVNVVSVNLPHSAVEDTNFKGYKISKGMIVLPNLASVHYDESLYPDSQMFKPERFLSADGFVKPEKFLPYSAGTRMCPGKLFSQWQLFLMLTSILQKYSLSVSGEVGEDTYGLIRFPANFKVVFNNRDQ